MAIAFAFVLLNVFYLAVILFLLHSIYWTVRQVVLLEERVAKLEANADTEVTEEDGEVLE